MMLPEEDRGADGQLRWSGEEQKAALCIIHFILLAVAYQFSSQQEILVNKAVEPIHVYVSFDSNSITW